MFEKLNTLFSKKVAKTVETVNPNLGGQATSVAIYLVYAIVFIIPLFFVPVLADAFDLPRQTLLFVLALLSAGAYLLHVFTINRPTVFKSTFNAPLFLLAGVFTVSALLSVNKFAALGTDPVLYAGLAITFLILTQVINRESLFLTVTQVFLFSASLLSAFSLLQVGLNLVGIGNSVPLPAMLAPFLSPAFSPTGSVLSQAIFLAIILPTSLGLWYQTKRQKQSVTFSLATTALIALGLLANLYTLFGSRPVILPLESGWRIATGTIGQSLTTAFFGVGPGHFLDSFTVYKPIEFNNSIFWNLRFITSSNLYFYLLTTTGIAGLASFLWLSYEVVQAGRKRFASGVAGLLEKGLIVSLFTALSAFAILPAPQVALFAFIVILGLFVASLRLAGNTKFITEDANMFDEASWPRPAVALAILALLLAGLYFLGRMVLADYHFGTSLRAAAANAGTQTYNEQIAALELNPWNESYRVSYSQTNLALANALASQPNLSDQQKQTILALIQQSIREGRNAVSLEPRRANDWENLSLIYRNLINFAQGADQFAIATQNQAINYDSANPRLRLDLGGIYFSLKDYQSAAQAFAQAVTLKSDYANAHYNLAQVLKLLKVNDQALQQLQLTASLVCANSQSPDCQKVNAEITDLGGVQTATGSAAQAPIATASAQTNLPKAKTIPPAKLSSPSGELTPQ